MQEAGSTGGKAALRCGGKGTGGLSYGEAASRKEEQFIICPICIIFRLSHTALPLLLLPLLLLLLLLLVLVSLDRVVSASGRLLAVQTLEFEMNTLTLSGADGDSRLEIGHCRLLTVDVRL